MTKEELEKEIKNYIDENCNQWETDGLTADDIVRIAVLDFAEPREKRIEELEQKLEQTEKDLTDYQFNYPKIKDLEKENALLKGRNKGFEQQIMGLLIKYEEVYKRFPDLKSAMDKAKAILKENVELKEHIKADCIDCADYIKNQKLEKENAELKDKNTEAKEIIRALLFHLNKDTFAVIYETREESIKKAEQFLKEVEK